MDEQATFIETCSAGAMLRGVIHCETELCKGFEVYPEMKRKLVKVPDGQRILDATLSVAQQINQIKSIEEKIAFEQSIKNKEKSVWANIKAFKMGGGDLGWIRNVADSETTESFDLNKYFSEVHSTIYSVACIQFDKNQLKLSDEAFQALTDIQIEANEADNYEQTDRRQYLYPLCKTFFDDFGSHIYCGLIHLGGVLTKTSTFHGETTSSTDQIQRAVSTAFHAHTGFGYSGVNFEVSARKMKTDGKMTKTFNDDLLDNTHVVCRQYGGPPISKNFTEDDWKESLSTSRSNWVVIDKEDFKESDYVPVWKLLPKDAFDDKFCHMLQHYYVTFLYRHEIFRITQAVCNFRKAVKLDLLKDAICDILIKTNYLRNTIGIKEEWLFLVIDEKYIADFLLTPRSNYTKLPTEDLGTIAEAVDELMRLVGEADFFLKDDITDMLKDIHTITKGR